MTASAPRKLLITTQWYKPELIGTAHYSSDFAEWFSLHGMKVTVLTNRPNYPANRVFPEYADGLKDDEKLCHVRVVRLPTMAARSGNVIGRLAAEFHFLLRGTIALMFGRLKRQQVVVSFCPTILAVLLGWFATKRGGRHVAVVHDIQSGLAAGLRMLRYGFLFSVFRWVERFCLNRADHVVVLSDQMRTALLKLGVRRPVSVIPIWVDEKKVFPQKKDAGPNPVLLYSGNLGRKQGLDQLLDLAAILGRERPDVRLLIRGNGFQETTLMDSVKERGLDNIEFEPLLPLEKFNDGLADGDIHLAPQSPDAADFAVPSKIYSIMAAGRPIVATALQGSALWDMQGATEGAVICVPPNDPQAFARAVLPLLDDEGLRRELGRKGRRYVESFASRDIVLSRYASLLTGEVQA